MPATFELDLDRGLLMIELAGVLTGADLDELSGRIRQEPAFDGTWPALVDASALDPAGLSSDAIRTRAGVARDPAVRVAVVAPADAVFGLARMFQMMSEGRGNHVEVFRGRDEALAWLASGSGPS